MYSTSCIYPFLRYFHPSIHPAEDSSILPPPPSASTSSLCRLPSSSSSPSSHLRRLSLPPSFLGCLILWRSFTSAALPLSLDDGFSLRSFVSQSFAPGGGDGRRRCSWRQLHLHGAGGEATLGSASPWSPCRLNAAARSCAGWTKVERPRGALGERASERRLHVCMWNIRVSVAERHSAWTADSGKRERAVYECVWVKRSDSFSRRLQVALVERPSEWVWDGARESYFHECKVCGEIQIAVSYRVPLKFLVFLMRSGSVCSCRCLFWWWRCIMCSSVALNMFYLQERYFIYIPQRNTFSMLMWASAFKIR